MEDENFWKLFDEQLLARLAGARRTALRIHRLPVREACECVFYSTPRFVLLESFNVRDRDIIVSEMGGSETDQNAQLE